MFEMTVCLFLYFCHEKVLNVENMTSKKMKKDPFLFVSFMYAGAVRGPETLQGAENLPADIPNMSSFTKYLQLSKELSKQCEF